MLCGRWRDHSTGSGFPDCSRQCAGAARRERIVKLCAYCGENVERRPSEIVSERGNVFCSRVHACAWQLAQRGINGLEESFRELFPEFFFVGDGKIQIDFGGRKQIAPDFILPGTNIVIELFGDFWHAGENPDDRAGRLAEAGFDAHIIWESEFREQLDDVAAQMQVILDEAVTDMPVEELTCARCGEDTFEIPSSVAERTTYFCGSCVKEMQENPDERVRRRPSNTECAECGKPLYRKPFRLKKSENSYCDRVYASKAQSRHYAKLRRNKPHNCTCDECGTTFYRAPSVIAMSKKHFCSEACRKAGKWK